MSSFRGIEGRDSDQAVDAAFGLEKAKGIFAPHPDRGALDSRLVSRLEIDDCRLEPPAFRPPEVHSQKHLGPVLGLGSPGPGMDLDNGRAVGVFVGENFFKLELVDLLDEERQRLCGFGKKIRVIPHLEQGSDLLLLPSEIGDEIPPFFDAPLFPEQAGRPFGVFPEFRISRLGLELF